MFRTSPWRTTLLSAKTRPLLLFLLLLTIRLIILNKILAFIRERVEIVKLMALAQPYTILPQEEQQSRVWLVTRKGGNVVGWQLTDRAMGKCHGKDAVGKHWQDTGCYCKKWYYPRKQLFMSQEEKDKRSAQHRGQIRRKRRIGRKLKFLPCNRVGRANEYLGD